MAEQCSYGRVLCTGASKKAGCNLRPEKGSIYCPQHRAEALARVIPNERIRPWPGLVDGYPRKLRLMPE